MHSAPSVSYPLGRSHFHGYTLGLIGLAGTAVGALWLFDADVVGWRHWLFFTALFLTCIVSAETWRRTPAGRLHWDGAVWCRTDDHASVSGDLSIHLDLQNCLILSLRLATGSRIWLWPERRTDVARWNDLRRAVFSPRPIRGAQDPGLDTAALAEERS
jgi:toxin CptA